MPKILLVDDSTTLRNTCEMLLTSNGYDIFHAENAFKGIEIYKKHHPDLIIMDIVLPELDGLTAAKKIREIDSESKIIILTAYPEKEQDYHTQGLKLFFMIKPFDADYMLSTIKRLLSE